MLHSSAAEPSHVESLVIGALRIIPVVMRNQRCCGSPSSIDSGKLLSRDSDGFGPHLSLGIGLCFAGDAASVGKLLKFKIVGRRAMEVAQRERARATGGKRSSSLSHFKPPNKSPPQLCTASLKHAPEAVNYTSALARAISLDAVRAHTPHPEGQNPRTGDADAKASRQPCSQPCLAFFDEFRTHHLIVLRKLTLATTMPCSSAMSMTLSISIGSLERRESAIISRADASASAIASSSVSKSCPSGSLRKFARRIANIKKKPHHI
jgi:hypothetical protein